MTNTYKSITFSQPSSVNAGKLGFARTGAWHVEITLADIEGSGQCKTFMPHNAEGFMNPVHPDLIVIYMETDGTMSHSFKHHGNPEVLAAIAAAEAALQDAKENTHAACCAWEHVQAVLNNSKTSYWQDRIDAYGTNDVRYKMHDIAIKLNAAYETVKEEFDDCFDWEFVPVVLDAVSDPLTATQAQYNTAAQQLVARPRT